MDRTQERGNVLFYILIAVALVAALSLAIANSMRSNTSDVEGGRYAILAGELVDTANTFSNGVAQLRLRGVAETDLCFDALEWEDFEEDENYGHSGCDNTANRIFHPDGAGLVWSTLPKTIFDDKDTEEPDYFYHFIGDNEIKDIGSTCSRPECSELLFLVDELSKTVCLEINNLLGIENPRGEPPEDNVYGDNRFRGFFSFSETIGDSASSRPLVGQRAGCFESQSQNTYVFYRVLLAR